MTAAQFAIVDCHVHFVDAHVRRYPIFEQRSPAFEALVGDYSALPRRFLPEHYLNAAGSFHVTKTVCAEFLSDSPFEEVRWAAALSQDNRHPAGVIAAGDFAASDLEHTLDQYLSENRVHVVRQHLAWHPANPLLRFAAAPDIMSTSKWRRGVRVLHKRGLGCETEIFAHQLPDLFQVASSLPDQQFILPLLGWPLDLSAEGRQMWKRHMQDLSRCPNVAVKIFGFECIFGLNWTLDQVRPWVLEVIELFGPARCMFASHMPLTLLACTFEHLYNAYLELVSGFSAPEQQQLFCSTAATVYGV